MPPAYKAIRANLRGCGMVVVQAEEQGGKESMAERKLVEWALARESEADNGYFTSSDADKGSKF